MSWNTRVSRKGQRLTRGWASSARVVPKARLWRDGRVSRALRCNALTTAGDCKLSPLVGRCPACRRAECRDPRQGAAEFDAGIPGPRGQLQHSPPEMVRRHPCFQEHPRTHCSNLLLSSRVAQEQMFSEWQLVNERPGLLGMARVAIVGRSVFSIGPLTAWLGVQKVAQVFAEFSFRAALRQLCRVFAVLR